MSEKSLLAKALEERIVRFGAAGEGKFEAELRFDPEFPGFAGHFEGNPLVPGVCLIQAAELLAERALQKPVAIRSIGQVKIFRPLQPGDSGVFTLAVEGSRLSGSVATGPGERVCKFTMELEMK